MHRFRIHGCMALALAAFALPALTQSTPHVSTVDDLRQGFLHPPDDARPMVRWWWFGAAVTKPELLRELQQMKADGIGGAELAFVYPEVLDDPAKDTKNLPFLSIEMLDAVHYAQAEGRKLGLRIDVTLCSGWPYGGPNTPLSEAAGRLRVEEVAVPPGASSITLPTFAVGETLLSASIAHGEPKHWTLSTAEPLPLQIPHDSNALSITTSSERRVALIFIASHTKQQVKRAAVGAEGYVLDPFSKQAVATHLAKVGTPLVQAFGDTPPNAIFSDSLEAYGADWTPALPEEFKKRRGYDLLEHLPELVAGGTPAAEKVRHDWGRTLTELVNENYLSQINNWALSHGTKFRSQTYGEPAVSFSSQQLVSLPEGEGPQWRAFSTLRWATSANHVFGNNVTSGETFTWLHSPVFRATPLDMKAEADIDFIMGENQLIFHGWPYSPPASEQPAGDPGWSLYAAGVFNDHNPWHPVMPAVTKYIQRLSWMLRQGKPANQVAVLLPTDDAWASFSPGKVTVTGAMQQLVPKDLLAAILSAGYNYDFIDAEAISKVGLGTHQIVVLPPTDRLPLTTAETLRAFVSAGGKVFAFGKRPTMDADGHTTPAFTALMAQLFGGGNGVSLQSDVVSAALHRSMAPDFSIAKSSDEDRNALGFIRRTLPEADIYYVVNTSNRAITADVHFATRFNTGQRWDAASGERQSHNISADAASLTLAPYESALFIFSKAAEKASGVSRARTASAQSVDISADWHVNFTALQTSITLPTLTDWATDPATRHYSGEAIYTRDVTFSSVAHAATYLQITGGTALPGSPEAPREHEALGKDGLPNPLITRTGPGMHAYYDPPVREAALVFINGQSAGALWHPPYRLDITALLKPGTNHIEIRVYNTDLNAWSGIPPRDYGPLKAKYGDRFQMQDLDKVAPLPSGILGTIQLVTESPQ